MDDDCATGAPQAPPPKVFEGRGFVDTEGGMPELLPTLAESPPEAYPPMSIVEPGDSAPVLLECWRGVSMPLAAAVAVCAEPKLKGAADVVVEAAASKFKPPPAAGGGIDEACCAPNIKEFVPALDDGAMGGAAVLGTADGKEKGATPTAGAAVDEALLLPNIKGAGADVAAVVVVVVAGSASLADAPNKKGAGAAAVVAAAVVAAAVVVAVAVVVVVVAGSASLVDAPNKKGAGAAAVAVAVAGSPNLADAPHKKGAGAAAGSASFADAPNKKGAGAAEAAVVSAAVVAARPAPTLELPDDENMFKAEEGVLLDADDAGATEKGPEPADDAEVVEEVTAPKAELPKVDFAAPPKPPPLEIADPPPPMPLLPTLKGLVKLVASDDDAGADDEVPLLDAEKEEADELLPNTGGALSADGILLLDKIPNEAGAGDVVEEAEVEEDEKAEDTSVEEAEEGLFVDAAIEENGFVAVLVAASCGFFSSATEALLASGGFPPNETLIPCGAPNVMPAGAATGAVLAGTPKVTPAGGGTGTDVAAAAPPPKLNPEGPIEPGAVVALTAEKGPPPDENEEEEDEPLPLARFSSHFLH